ncbi:MAG: T9SS type A sorting domain-containing protein, partial [Bacteroidetes bacterium]|nr:T9SS type A sorting domain-containing protein [Bacteroidota bacterium]
IWSRTYGGALVDVGQHLLADNKGFFYILGTTTSFGSGGRDIYFIKVDSNGNHIWSRTFGGSLDEDLSGLSSRTIMQTSDGGFAILASTNSFGAGNSDFFLIKTDSNGLMIDDCNQTIPSTLTTSPNVPRVSVTPVILNHSTGAIGNTTAGAPGDSTSQLCCSMVEVLLDTTICNGDSIMIDSQLVGTAGVYSDTVITQTGCDSISSTILSVEATFTSSRKDTICNGDSLLIGGVYQTSSGIYSDMLTATNGCDSIDTVDLTVIVVDTSVTRTGNTLHANATNATFQWLSCQSGLPIPGDTSSDYTADSGEYAVAIAQYGCTDTSKCHNVNIPGVKPIKSKFLVSIHPNPGSDEIVIEIKGQYRLLDLKIFDITAREVLHQKVSDKTATTISIINFPPGLYYLIVHDEKYNASFKMIKQ